MSDDPWKNEIPANYKPGMLIVARVTRVYRLGVAVELEPGLEGRVDLTEMSPSMSVGQEIIVRILDVDTDEKQIVCSTKSAAGGRL